SPDSMAKALQTAIQKGSTYDPQNNPGDVIGITMRYVGSRNALGGPYQVAIAQMLTQASPRVVNLASVRVCVDTLRPPNRRGPFEVWDGPGGGQIHTQMDGLPGDELTCGA